MIATHFSRAYMDAERFRRFERRIGGLGVREQWYKFRSNALAEIAIEFLEAKGIPYTRD